jgi:hypothetical protein
MGRLGAGLPSPLAGEGLGVRGPRRQARDEEAPCGAGPLIRRAARDTFSRKGRKEAWPDPPPGLPHKGGGESAASLRTAGV